MPVGKLFEYLRSSHDHTITPEELQNLERCPDINNKLSSDNSGDLMETDRLIRFTVAGWGLLLSWLFHLWILGSPNVEALIKGISGTLVVGLMSGPFLGFMISVIAEQILRCWRGGSTTLSIIETPEELFRFVSDLKKLLPEMSSELDKIYGDMPCEFRVTTCSTASWNWRKRRRFIKNAKRFEAYFNFLHHSKNPEPILKFNTRRWTIYWMSLNSLWAIFIGAVCAFITAGDFHGRHFFPNRFFMEVPIIIAFVLLWWKHRDRRDEINRIARLWLYSKAEGSHGPAGNSP